MNTQPELIRSIWEDIAAGLESHKKRIYQQIKNYPPPITGCDQQFNHLLDEQARISQELGRMRQAVDESLTRRDAIEMIDQFIRSSRYIDDEAAQRIRARLKEQLPELKA